MAPISFASFDFSWPPIVFRVISSVDDPLTTLQTDLANPNAPARVAPGNRSSSPGIISWSQFHRKREHAESQTTDFYYRLPYTYA